MDDLEPQRARPTVGVLWHRDQDGNVHIIGVFARPKDARALLHTSQEKLLDGGVYEVTERPLILPGD